MNSCQKFLGYLSLFFTVFLGHGAEIPLLGSMPSSYYTPENMQKLDAQQATKHAPCALLLQEKPDEGSMGFALAAFVHYAKAPIVLSVWTLMSYLRDWQKLHEYYQLFCDKLNAYQKPPILDQGSWQLFHLPNSWWYLLVPKFYTDYYGIQGFNAGQLANISFHLPTNNSDSYDSLLNYLERKHRPQRITLIQRKPCAIQPQNVQKIFAPYQPGEKYVIWDFTIIGHGKYKADICGLCISRFQKILKTIDQWLRVGSAYLVSCYLGGNIEEIEKSFYGPPENYSFNIFVGSVTESSVSALHTLPRIPGFFEKAAICNNFGKGLDNLVKVLYDPNNDASTIPYILLKNNSYFMMLNIINNLYSLGKVNEAVAALDKKELIIKDKKVILLHPTIIRPTLVISPFCDIEHNLPRFPEIISCQHPNLEVEQSDGCHLLHKIVLTRPTNDVTNKLSRFIEESFTPSHGRITDKLFFIDELSGINDIDNLEQKNQLVTLKKVMIGGTDKPQAKFILNDRAWSLCHTPYTVEPKLTEIDKARYEQQYNKKRQQLIKKDNDEK